MGVGGGVSVSPDVSGVRQFAGQRAAGAGWLAGTRDGSSLRGLLPAALDEFAAPDLVRRDGGEPAIAGDVWARDGCNPSHCEIDAECYGGWGTMQHRKRATGQIHIAD